MTLFSHPFKLSCAVALALPALLAGCSSTPQPTSFAPLRYTYLGQINLNASRLEILDNSTTNPVEGDIGPRAPTPPAQALRDMAQDRLAAASSNGSTAQFVIDRASILHETGGTLNGQMDVHLDILNPGGTQAAHAEAHVTRMLRPDPAQGDVDSQANLYDLTRDMMQNMNVELEYQIRSSLRTWLVDAGGTPVGSAIQTQQLGGSAATNTPTDTNSTTNPANAPVTVETPKVDVPALTTPTVTVGGTPSTAAKAVTNSEPDAVFPAGEGDDTPASTPKIMSPKAGYLKLPGSSKTQ